MGESCAEFKSGDFIKAENISDYGAYPVFGGNGLRGYTDRYNHDGDYALIGRQGALCGNMNYSSGKAYFTEHAVAVRANSLNDTLFFFYCLGTMNLGQYSGQSAQPGLAVSNLIELQAMMPPKEEQEKISVFLSSLDNLITLHQRMCAFFGSTLQIRMDYPLAFAWEQRKLGELVDRVVRKNINLESTLPLTISAQYGLVDQITYFNNRVASHDVSNYYLVLNGEFAYNKSTSDGFPFGAVKRLDLYENGVLSTLYIVFSIKDVKVTNSDFLTVFFDTDRWHKGVSERAAEGARNHGLLNISADDFFDIDLYLPRQEAEQKQIGAYFKQLDDLITLHQRELKHTKNNQKL